MSNDWAEADDALSCEVTSLLVSLPTSSLLPSVTLIAVDTLTESSVVVVIVTFMFTAAAASVMVAFVVLLI
jgi:hypothetical protein